MTIEIKDKDIETPYCDKCDGCGYIGCDGIKTFLEKHVKGKTDCLNEDSFIQEIIEYCEMKDDDIYNQAHQAGKEEAVKNILNLIRPKMKTGRKFDILHNVIDWIKDYAKSNNIKL